MFDPGAAEERQGRLSRSEPRPHGLNPDLVPPLSLWSGGGELGTIDPAEVDLFVVAYPHSADCRTKRLTWRNCLGLEKINTRIIQLLFSLDFFWRDGGKYQNRHLFLLNQDLLDVSPLLQNLDASWLVHTGPKPWLMSDYVQDSGVGDFSHWRGLPKILHPRSLYWKTLNIPDVETGVDIQFAENVFERPADRRDAALMRTRLRRAKQEMKKVAQILGQGKLEDFLECNGTVSWDPETENLGRRLNPFPRFGKPGCALSDSSSQFVLWGHAVPDVDKDNVLRRAWPSGENHIVMPSPNIKPALVEDTFYAREGRDLSTDEILNHKRFGVLCVWRNRYYERTVLKNRLLTYKRNGIELQLAADENEQGHQQDDKIPRGLPVSVGTVQGEDLALTLEQKSGSIEDTVRATLFCPSPHGDQPHVLRFYDAINHLCIPIVFVKKSDSYFLDHFGVGELEKQSYLPNILSERNIANRTSSCTSHTSEDKVSGDCVREGGGHLAAFVEDSGSQEYPAEHDEDQISWFVDGWPSPKRACALADGEHGIPYSDFVVQITNMTDMWGQLQALASDRKELGRRFFLLQQARRKLVYNDRLFARFFAQGKEFVGEENDIDAEIDKRGGVFGALLQRLKEGRGREGRTVTETQIVEWARRLKESEESRGSQAKEKEEWAIRVRKTTLFRRAEEWARQQRTKNAAAFVDLDTTNQPRVRSTS